jgi:hypothetical protein
MTIEKEKSGGPPYHAVRVRTGGKVKILSEGELPTGKPYPTEPGEYQLRPVSRVWSSSAEHGSWIPVFEWAPGIVEPEEWPSTEELPEGGTL